MSLLFLLEMVIIIYYLKKRKKKDFLPTVRVTLVGTRFKPRTSEFHTYQSNYVTRPNDLGYSDYLCMLAFSIAYYWRFD